MSRHSWLRAEGAALAAAILTLTLLAEPPPASAQSKSGPSDVPESTAGVTAKSVASGIPEGFLLLGDQAPDFKLRDQRNREVRFHPWREDQMALLIFVDRSSELDPEYSSLVGRLAEQSVRAVAVCRKVGALPAGLDRSAAEAPILRDRWGDVARQYGVVDRLSGDAVPAVVVVDAKGKVRYLAAGALPEPSLLEGIVYGVQQKEAEGVY
jgi:peroxiredoxin